MSDTIQARIQREHGISDRTLARELGVSPMAVGLWRRGLSKPTGLNLLRLLTELGKYERTLTIEALLGEPAKPLPSEAEVFKNMTDEVK